MWKWIPSLTLCEKKLLVLYDFNGFPTSPLGCSVEFTNKRCFPQESVWNLNRECRSIFWYYGSTRDISASDRPILGIGEDTRLSFSKVIWHPGFPFCRVLTWVNCQLHPREWLLLNTRLQEVMWLSCFRNQMPLPVCCGLVLITVSDFGTIEFHCALFYLKYLNVTFPTKRCPLQ